MTALPYLEKALAIEERTLPAYHRSLAITHYNLSRLLDLLHRYDEAAAYAKKAVEIATHNYSPGHSRMTMYETCLARILQKLHV